MVNEIFETINYDIFGDMLEHPIWRMTDLVDYYGFYHNEFGMDIIELNNDLSYYRGWCTIAHEMIHMYMYNDGNKKWHTHNMTFKMYARKIERFYKLKSGAI